MSLDPQKAGDYGTFLGGLVAFFAMAWAMVRYPRKTFLTKEAASFIYVRKVEEDGSALYVRASDFARVEKKLDESIAQNDKWLRIAKDWIEHQ